MIRTAIVVTACLALGCAAAQEPTPQPSPDARATPEAWYGRGLDWARRGDMVRAEQYMALAVRAGYPEHRALVGIVEACLAASRLRAALNYAEPYLRKHPDAWRVRLLVASIHAALGHDLVARDQLVRVNSHAAASADGHYLLAILLDERFHDASGARAQYLSYLERDPGGEHAAEAEAWLAQPRDALPLAQGASR